MTDSQPRFITIAVHTYEKAVELRSILESEGIEVTLQNVHTEHPQMPSAIRVRISESDLQLALRIIENREIFIPPHSTAVKSDADYVLVPVDFSDYTLNAVRLAAAIAARHRATITLLNSYIDPYVGGEGLQLTDALSYDIADAEARQSLSLNAKKMMDSLVASIREEMKNGTITAVKFGTEIIEGVPEDAISSYAKSRPPLITVMGTRGADKKEKEMIGSVTAEVLDSCLFPVLTIPEPLISKPKAELNQILFFCNADQEDILAMDSLVQLFPEAQCSVTLALMPSRRRWLNRQRQLPDVAVSEYFGRSYPRFRFESITLEADKAVETISRLHANHTYDLIVVPNKKKKNILNRMFNPSLAHRLIFKADIPMLVIPV